MARMRRSRFADPKATAELRLLRLRRCKAVTPYRPNDDELVCANDGFALESSPTGWRHSADEIARMEAAAS